MPITCHSEYGSFESLFIKNVSAAFSNQDAINDQWQALHYLECPDYNLASEEYHHFESILTEHSNRIFHFSSDETVGMDSIYCRDASIATDYGMILCNMGKNERGKEPAAALKVYAAHGISILGQIIAPGSVEGGDVAWLDQHTLAVGHSYRTNAEGIAQLKLLLEPKGITVLVTSLPHFKGKEDVFHLMSIVSPIDLHHAVVYAPLMPIDFRNELLKRNMNLIEVPAEEFESMGCNVLGIGNKKCLMVAGNPLTQARIEKAGFQVHTYSGAEISVKGGGGPTCLTRPIKRRF